MLNIFNKKKTEAPALAANAATPAPVQNQNQNQLADIVLNNIHDGVIIVNPNGVIEFINPAAVVMTDCKDPSNAIGLDYALLMKLKTKDGRELTPEENPLFRATATNQPLEGYACLLISGNSAKLSASAALARL